MDQVIILVWPNKSRRQFTTSSLDWNESWYFEGQNQIVLLAPYLHLLMVSLHRRGMDVLMAVPVFSVWFKLTEQPAHALSWRALPGCGSFYNGYSTENTLIS